MTYALDPMRSYLLPKTLEYAATNSSFYTDHWGEVWREVDSLAALATLPLLNKEIAAAHQAEMRCGAQDADLGAASSGTTSTGTEFLIVEHSRAEDEAIGEFYAMLAASELPGATEAPAADPAASMVLHLFTPNHGMPRGDEPDVVRLAWSPDPKVCWIIYRALCGRYSGRRIGVMRAPLSALKQLTVYLTAHGIDLRALKLEAIGTSGAMITARWRRRLTEAWGCRLADNYSLSEFITPATECEACGWYHFMYPPIVTEVIDPITHAPVHEGIGELVLTSLFPYAQRQPLIRYATRDLIELGPDCDHFCELSFRPLGRLRQTGRLPGDDGDELLLFAPHLEEVLDEVPTVARHVHPFEKVGALPEQTVGMPKYKIDANPAERTLVASAGVTFEPVLFPDAATALSDSIRSQLLQRHSRLAERVAAGSAQLEVRLVGRHDAEPGWFFKHLM